VVVHTNTQTHTHTLAQTLSSHTPNRRCFSGGAFHAIGRGRAERGGGCGILDLRDAQVSQRHMHTLYGLYEVNIYLNVHKQTVCDQYEIDRH